MNDKRFNFALLLALVLTLVAVSAHQYFPQKRFLAWPNQEIKSYFYSSAPKGSASPAFWVDKQQSLWRCAYPDIDRNQYFACSFNALFEKAFDRGIDLSDYSHVNLSINYTGNAHRIRVYLRTFDPTFSTITDSNSTKVNTLLIHTRDLHKELRVDLDEFIVADWWLNDYDIPRELARPDFSNVMTLGLEYVEGQESGNQDMQIEKIEFAGEWISAEKWYLLILVCWMLGIFSYSIIKLIQLRKQTKRDVKVIRQLNTNNTELKLETDKFRRLSTVDTLTQAYNRFGIDHIISTLLKLNQENDQQREAPDFALMVIDIDHFKRINDRRGHDAGDRILQTIAALLRKGIREQDFLGRWGGEEFIVVLPNTHQECALALAEKIRLIIYATVFEPDNPLSITISIGVSDRLGTEDFASTFKRADQALYEAKAQGRNCCVITDDNKGDL